MLLETASLLLKGDATGDLLSALPASASSMKALVLSACC